MPQLQRPPPKRDRGSLGREEALWGGLGLVPCRQRFHYIPEGVWVQKHSKAMQTFTTSSIQSCPKCFENWEILEDHGGAALVPSESMPELFGLRKASQRKASEFSAEKTTKSMQQHVPMRKQGHRMATQFRASELPPKKAVLSPIPTLQIGDPFFPVWKIHQVDIP